jgi:hypothetical protein
MLFDGGIEFNTKDFDKKFSQYILKSPTAMKTALEKAGIQFLTWANNGSPKESRKPPIRRGFLRGSSSVFRGSKLVGLSPTGDNKDAAKNNSEKDEFNLTWVWNSAYATKMHETEYNPGPFSTQDGDAGNKWAEKHLDADREALMKMIVVEFDREVSKI